jgi:hypothetical protein
MIQNIRDIRHAVPAILLNEAATYAWVRFLCLKYGLISALWTVEELNCDYNQCTVLVDTPSDAFFADDDDVFARDQYDNFTGVLTAVPYADINAIFTNIVCCVAFMFRARGHHFKENYLPRYASLWEKLNSSQRLQGLSWERMSTVALHAIPPIVLDRYWRHCATNVLCEGPLRLRINCASAGTAAFVTAMVGLRDLKVTLPGAVKLMEEEAAYIEETIDHLNAHRWDYSINARFYGANTNRLDESKVGAVAAVIKGVLSAIDEEDDLLKSQALIRIAKLAPITGGVLSTGINTYIQSKEFQTKFKLQ